MALENPYRRRALPPGSIRYLSWLFAAPAARDAWMGIFALQAEWRALLSPATDRAVAAVKLAWWRDEMLRLTEGRGVHPICRFLAQLPGAPHTDFRALVAAIEAVEGQFSGVPVERGRDLGAHAEALYAGPLRTAVSLSGAALSPRAAGALPGRQEPALWACTAAAAVGKYLGRALSDHRGDVRRGLIAFPVDELLATGIDNAALAAAEVSPRLHAYLENKRREAVSAFERAASALPPESRPAHRGLVVLIELERRRLEAAAEPATTALSGTGTREDNALLMNLWWAWRAARRAANPDR